MMKNDEKRCKFRKFRSDQKHGFLVPIGLKIWDQVFLDLEIQKIHSVRPDLFNNFLFHDFSCHLSGRNFEWTEHALFFRVTRRSYNRWKGLDEIYNLSLFFFFIFFVFSPKKK